MKNICDFCREDEFMKDLHAIYSHTFESYYERLNEYYGAAEPPVRCGESHLSGLTEPPHFVY